MRRLVLISTLVLILTYILLPSGGLDYSHDIARAARLWWQTPWLNGLPQAPYLALLLSPLGYLPDRLATGLLNGLSTFVIGLVLRRNKGPLWLLIPILISPFGYWLFIEGQTDGVVLYGLLLPLGFGLPLLLIKPQTTAWAVVTYLIARPRLRYLVPLLLVLSLSLLLWGMWPLEIAKSFSWLTRAEWNSTLWPWSILPGLGIFIYSLHRKDVLAGAAASPLLFPYVNFASWLPVVIWLCLRKPKLSITIWALVFALSVRCYL